MKENLKKILIEIALFLLPIVIILGGLYIGIVLVLFLMSVMQSQFVPILVMLLFFALVLHFILAPLIEFRSRRKEANRGPDPNDILAMIVLISVVINAGSKGLEEKKRVVKSFLQDFGEKKSKKMMKQLDEKLKKDIRNLPHYCARVRRLFTYPGRIKFMNLLFRITEINGEIYQYEAEMLEYIAEYLRIDDDDFIALTRRFTAYKNFRKKQEEEQKRVWAQMSTSYHNSSWAYQTLMIAENSSMEEVKKAYRKLAMLHHPDKAGSHNAAQIQAAEKFRQINKAYEHLKNSTIYR